MATKLKLVTIVAYIAITYADIFMSNPRGSNNRLNEESNNRANGNRLFDSQNNNKGGYNVGERFPKKNTKDPRHQYRMQYFGSGAGEDETSFLTVEWANQHGCGPRNRKSTCNVVIQYMCMTNGTDAEYPTSGKTAAEGHRRATYMRDGTSTETQGYQKPKKKLSKETQDAYEERIASILKNDINADRGLHESLQWYDMCRYREANGGLFRADQQLNNDNVGYVPAFRTRQNSAGTRRGYECPEERDYYPYWIPTIQGQYNADEQKTSWLDAAYLGERCTSTVAQSFNTRDKFRCVLDIHRDYGRSIDEESCKAEGGRWVSFTSYLEVLEDIRTEGECMAKAATTPRNTIVWGLLRSDASEMKCIVKAPGPACGTIPNTRVNHLGNSATHANNASRFTWELPHFPSGQAKRCVLRLRYNISTSDYDVRNTFGDSNGDESPITNDPTEDVFEDGNGLTIALNTAQFGRTFQDRSHVFEVLPRMPSMTGKQLYNLNVRGQRGNIVQTFPAVEYDFVPDKLTVTEDDLVHIQWTGINTNVKDRAGEGTDQTDRHNFVELTGDPDSSIPAVLSRAPFWESVVSVSEPGARGIDVAVALASAGYYCGKQPSETCPAEFVLGADGRDALQGQLNNAPPSYFGHVIAFKGPGQVYYMCSRNNNFTNRSQKGMIYITATRK